MRVIIILAFCAMMAMMPVVSADHSTVVPPTPKAGERDLGQRAAWNQINLTEHRIARAWNVLEAHPNASMLIAAVEEAELGLGSAREAYDAGNYADAKRLAVLAREKLVAAFLKAKLKLEVAQVKQAVKQEVKAVRQEAKAEIKQIRNETKAAVKEIRQDARNDTRSLIQEKKEEVKAKVAAKKTETKAKVAAKKQEVKAKVTEKKAVVNAKMTEKRAANSGTTAPAETTASTEAATTQ